MWKFRFAGFAAREVDPVDSSFLGRGQGGFVNKPPLELMFCGCGCPILAVFARVGILDAPSVVPGRAESKPPPFENHKGWGTRIDFAH
jgi:hypothetical protein